MGQDTPPVTILRAGCKINLFLLISGRRDDGYHLLDSLFLPLPTPFDTITITPKDESGLDFACNDSALAGSDNIMAKACAVFAKATGFHPGLAVFLDKKIPYGAGLGGGSSDAAALLLYLNREARRENKDLTDKALAELAAGLGADVPFFLLNRPARVSGIGEIIHPCANPLRGLHLVLVAPPIPVASAWAYKAYDEKNSNKHTRSVLTNRVMGDSTPLVRGISVKNDLAPVVFARHPELRKIVASLYAFNAAAAAMSGSGSSIFGLYEKEPDARDAFSFFLDAGERVFYYPL
ncbi:4-diphosphocytidyl-2-C-methyl-D-erythritol kinase [Deltaproteobacteria bacterium]|nr:4-diphosphocytidyl-2-C-methyl-D-erythritol kinase [Deltaproteobacteria bacterium]